MGDGAKASQLGTCRQPAVSSESHSQGESRALRRCTPSAKPPGNSGDAPASPQRQTLPGNLRGSQLGPNWPDVQKWGFTHRSPTGRGGGRSSDSRSSCGREGPAALIGARPHLPAGNSAGNQRPGTGHSASALWGSLPRRRWAGRECRAGPPTPGVGTDPVHHEAQSMRLVCFLGRQACLTYRLLRGA